MKLFISTIFITLVSMASTVQAFQVYNLDLITDFPDFAENENIPTWGTGNRLGDGANISYSFAESTEFNYPCDTASGCFSLNDFMPNGYQSVISSAFDAWASVSNLSFTKTTDKNGDIVLGAEIIDGTSGELGHASINMAYTSNGIETVTHITNGAIHFDRDENWLLTNNTGTSLYGIALHEIGHALGLTHSFDSNAVMYDTYSGINSLQIDDINGIQYLYGASVSPIPEPSTYALFLLGLAMVFGYGRRITPTFS